MVAPNAGFSPPTFDDFVLEVLDVRRGRAPRRVSKRRKYQVRLRTPAGDLQTTMRLPFDQDELSNWLPQFESDGPDGEGQPRRVLSSEHQRLMQEFGTALFEAALPDEASGLFHHSRALAESNRRGLRLKLRIEPPELAALPWEFLYDKRTASFVGLSTETPIVRDFGLAHAIQPLAVDGPLRILGMVANPNTLEPLDVGQERARVEKALEEPIAQGVLELHWLPGQTWEDLKDEIQRSQFHVFHFIGHGGFDSSADQGVIALADSAGEPYYLAAKDLAMLLADEPALRLVVLNSCDGARGGTQNVFSSTASILVRRTIPAVLAMQNDITDVAAIAFSRSFYRALALGSPLDAAVADGRKTVRLASPGSLEWATPVLYQRAPDGVLFGSVRPRPPEKAVPGQPKTGGNEVGGKSEQPRPPDEEETGPGSSDPPPPVGIDWLKSLGAALNVRSHDPNISEAKRGTIVMLNVVNWIMIVILVALLLDGLYGSKIVEVWIAAALILFAIVSLRQLGTIIENAGRTRAPGTTHGRR